MEELENRSDADGIASRSRDNQVVTINAHCDEWTIELMRMGEMSPSLRRPRESQGDVCMGYTYRVAVDELLW